jgi:glycosyltransferase involved in cell wall biosynthesis
MLSILIPTYNQDVTALVSELHRQAMEQYVDFEIIVAEDGSDKFQDKNKMLEQLLFVKYITFKYNIGRSAIRNKLADEAQYCHLLFIDCDAEVCSPYFIEKYLAFCHESCIVIGGTAYDANETNPAYSLRLTYGRKREARHANERDKNNFATFNFLISKDIFNQVRFDETIREYGNEDMIFGHALHQLGYEFIQIENPLIHKGLDENTLFLQKTGAATRNLLLMYKTGRYPYLQHESKLLKTFLLFEKLKLSPVLALIFTAFSSLIKRFLCSKKPSLVLYDLFKLGTICKINMTK